MLTRSAFGAAACAIMLASTVACSSEPQPGLRSETSQYDGQSEAGITATSLPLGRVYVLQAGNVCTTGAGVTIRSVEPVMRRGRLRVRAWGVRDQTPATIGGNDDPAGQRGVTLRRLGGFSHRPVRTPCKGSPGYDKNRSTELNIEMRARTAVTRVKWFTIGYGAGQNTVAYVGFGTCTPGVTRAECPDN